MSLSSSLPIRIVSSLKEAENANNNKIEETLQDSTNNKKSNNSQSPPPTNSNNIHWIISFDINETILVGDEVGGDTVDDCFNKIIAKSAFVRMPNNNNNNKDTTSADAEKQPPTDNVSYDYENTSSVTPTHWWDGTPLQEEVRSDEKTAITTTKTIPPLYTGWEWPEGCCPYYRTSLKRISKTFVNHHGSIYKPVYDEISKRLRRPDDAASAPTKSSSSSSSSSGDDDDDVFRNILPSFWYTINQLITEQEEQRRTQRQSTTSNDNDNDGVGSPPPLPPRITFVFRTFGTDLPQIAKAMTAFCRGEHPDYPNFIHPEYELDSSRLYYARWVPLKEEEDETNNNNNDDDDMSNTNRKTRSRKFFQYELYSQEDDHLIASGDQQVLDLLHGTTTTTTSSSSSSSHSVYGIQDDYDMWKSNNWEPWAGKPVWKTDDTNHHHLFFDDNIHNLEGDGIACVRQPASRSSGDSRGKVFETLDNADHWHGIHLVRVPTIEPILDEEWFLKQIRKVQSRAAGR